MTKKQALERWRKLPANQPIMPHFQPLPARTQGSTYGACGIRIDGNPEFIDAVLSRLTDLLEGENGSTRLALSRSKVDGVKIGKQFGNRDNGAEVCYIRLHQRGRDAQAIAAIFGAKAVAS